jgi:DNA processing protein
MRNRIISGLSQGVIVVESDAAGGAMITARFAGEQGRLLFAVPGRIDQPTSRGCHQLIRDGATLLTGVDDVLAELSYLDGLRPAAIRTEGAASVLEQLGAQLDARERALIDCLQDGAMLGVDALAAGSGLSAPEVSAALLMLELKKLVRKRADGSFEARA